MANASESAKSKGKSGGELTPLLKQFQQIKTQHPDHVLFFRCGDFYEMFFQDARTCAEVLGITLTSRGTDTEGNPVPLAGVPYHSVDGYLARMIRSGYRVAMCEQMENPKNVKGVVRREVVRVVTPGTVLEESLLTDKANNYLVALVAGDLPADDSDAPAAPVELGLAALDFSTGQFLVCEFRGATALQVCLTELIRLSPSEIVVSAEQRHWFQKSELMQSFSLDSAPAGGQERGTASSLATVDPAAISAYAARQALLEQFGTRDLRGYGVEESPLAIQAAGAVLQYLKETQRGQLTHINELRVHHPGEYMVLDGTTQRSLELVTNLTDATRRHTLFEVLDKTATAMGGRALRSWILQPLRDAVRINERLDAVDALVRNRETREKLGEYLKGIADMERIVSRCACGTANARDLLSLKNSLQRIAPIQQLIVGAAAAVVGTVGGRGVAVDPHVVFPPKDHPQAENQDNENDNPFHNGTTPFRKDAGADAPGATDGLAVLPVVGKVAQHEHSDDDESQDEKFVHSNGSLSGESVEDEGSRKDVPPRAPSSHENLLITLARRLDARQDLADRLEAAIVEQPPVSIRDGGMFREGYTEELDELRSLTGDSKSWIAALRQREAERTGISNLKIGFNRVFGYYLEVSNSHQGKVPPEWIRKQTLTNGERYVTPELKEKEEVILNADERANELEFRLFDELRHAVCEITPIIQQTARAVAELDAIYSLSVTAALRRYVRPAVTAEGGEAAAGSIMIRDGRHPVLETLRTDTPFVPNDTRINNEDEQILIITGPNMAGKSTYIRQVALITLMAHIGSFVPASEATIQTVDRIFTRVGAMDQIAKGQSTFLVEMSETANILNNATDHSLVILDEIGRGTSTYDGLSIAWSVVEYLHHTKGRRPKTLFATHYHELAGLEGPLPRVRNYNVAVHEEEDRVAFLYRILRGHTDHSYGIYAAQVAGLPRAAVDRARRILADLEKGNAIHVQAPGSDAPGKDKPVHVEEKTMQLTFFDLQDHPVLEKVRALDINSLTPLQALSFLAEIKHDAKQ